MQVFDKEIIKEKCKWLIMWEKCVFMLWEQGVEGSNPFAPTVERKKESLTPFFVFVHLSRRSMTSLNLNLFPVDLPMASMNCWS